MPPPEHLTAYRAFALKWLGHTKANIRLRFSDEGYNDEYYTGAMVEIALLDRTTRREFMDYDMQCREEDGEDRECSSCAATVEDDDTFCRKCGQKLESPMPQWTGEDAGIYYSELISLPFVWNGTNQEIEL